MKRRHFCASALATLAATTASKCILAAVAEALGPIKADLLAISGEGRSITLRKQDVEDFRRSLRGLLLTRDDEGYDIARKIWNGAFDRHPALIARCTGASDVVHAVNFARAHNLLVAVRGGGHSLSGQSVCEGGLMVEAAVGGQKFSYSDAPDIDPETGYAIPTERRARQVEEQGGPEDPR